MEQNTPENKSSCQLSGEEACFKTDFKLRHRREYLKQADAVRCGKFPLILAALCFIVILRTSSGKIKVNDIKVLLNSIDSMQLNRSIPTSKLTLLWHKSLNIFCYCYFENQLWQNKGKWHQSLNIFWQSKSWKRQRAAKAREKSFSKSNNKRTFPCFGSVHRWKLCKSKTNFPSTEFTLKSTS